MCNAKGEHVKRKQSKQKTILPDYVEVVRGARVRPVQVLYCTENRCIKFQMAGDKSITLQQGQWLVHVPATWFKADNDGGRDEAADAAAIDAQHRDEPPSDGEAASSADDTAARTRRTGRANRWRRPGSLKSIGGNGSVGGIFFSFHWTIGYERDRKLLVKIWWEELSEKLSVIILGGKLIMFLFQQLATRLLLIHLHLYRPKFAIPLFFQSMSRSRFVCLARTELKHVLHFNFF